MIKFVVVVYKRPDMTVEKFRDYFRDVHGPLAEKLPGLRKYVQNYAIPDATRKAPGWHCIVELFFDNFEAMQRAWSTPEGEAATKDLEACADLTRTTWSIVEEVTVR